MITRPGQTLFVGEEYISNHVRTALKYSLRGTMGPS